LGTVTIILDKCLTPTPNTILNRRIIFSVNHASIALHYLLPLELLFRNAKVCAMEHLSKVYQVSFDMGKGWDPVTLEIKQF
jgi:hypothetical protein